MSVCVLDGSAALSWVLPEQATPVVGALLSDVRKRGAIVPGLWRLEVMNVLVVSERRRRITPTERAEAFSMLRTLPIDVDQKTTAYAWTDTLGIADRHGLTVYDACYLELALRTQLPLASLDKALVAAARSYGLTVLT